MKRAHRSVWAIKILILALFSLSLAASHRLALAATPQVKADHPLERPFELDFRYQPQDWVTAVGLPDDWCKPLTDRSGALFYDYPGKFAVPCEGYQTGGATRVRVDLADAADEMWQSQSLEDPRLPIVTTKTRQGELEVEAKAFAVTDPAFWPGGRAELPPPRTTHWGIEQLKGGNDWVAWATPACTVDPGFLDAQYTIDAPLQFRFKAEPGKSYQAVFGFCENYYEKAAMPMDLLVEGQPRAGVDLAGGAGGKAGKNGVFIQSLADKYDAGTNTPFITSLSAKDLDGDGWINLEVRPAAGSISKRALLNVLWIFKELPPKSEIISGAVTLKALGYCSLGEEARIRKFGVPLMRPPRADLILATVRNSGLSPATARPRVLIQAQQGVSYDKASCVAILVAGERVTTSEAPEKVLLNENGDQLILTLPPVRLKPGESRRFVAAVHSNAAPSVWSVEAADKALQGARAFWQKIDLPYDVIRIPDPAMQGLLDSSIRNLRQAREVVDGKLRYQVGATIFRGIFVVDGSFMLEAEAGLGRVKDARAGLETFLSFQKPDGSFEMMPQYWKENGVMLWMIDRHEQLSGDQAWLEKNWHAVEGAVKAIQRLRREASKDPKALNAGLMPNGLSDGGFLNGVEYSSVYWTLMGLKSALAMAERLGKTEEAKAFGAEFADMRAVFRKAARRDLFHDEFGNLMLPVPMARPLTDVPQMAQWAFCQAVYPGELFTPGDPLMVGTLNNLIDNESEGLVRRTGWHKEGLWSYFGSFYAHDFLWLGDGEKAARTAYAFANHASPMLTWREEQSLQHQKTWYNGDMPHNWASAEFIRLMLHLLVFERGEELHLLEGLPPTWLKPGAVTSVNKALTRFGEISLELRVSKDGRTATLSVTPPTRTPPRRLVVHLPGGKTADLRQHGAAANGQIKMTWPLGANK